MKEKEIEKVKELLGENLVLLAVYGMDKKGTLIICNTLDLDTLQKLKKLEQIPLIFTKEELSGTQDVFPVEFLNIKQYHSIIYGQDILKDIVISKQHLRHQLEFEFRSKLIHLREEYLEFKGKDIEKLILAAVPALTPILGGLLYLVDMKDKEDIVKSVSGKFGIDMHILEEIQDIRDGKTKFKKDKEQYIKDLIKVLNEIGMKIDEYKVTE